MVCIIPIISLAVGFPNKPNVISSSSSSVNLRESKKVVRISSIFNNKSSSLLTTNFSLIFSIALRTFMADLSVNDPLPNSRAIIFPRWGGAGRPIGLPAQLPWGWDSDKTSLINFLSSDFVISNKYTKKS